MITPREIEQLVEGAIDGAKAAAKDLTGTQDHYELQVVAAAFSGLGTMERHRQVYAALAEPLKGPLHAVTLKTLTPEEANKR